MTDKQLQLLEAVKALGIQTISAKVNINFKRLNRRLKSYREFERRSRKVILQCD